MRRGFLAREHAFAIMRHMTSAMKEALAVLRDLPEDRQETVARAILDYAANDDVYHLSDDERNEVQAGLEEIARGDIATQSEVLATYKRLHV
jgi:predicted transcriptional regulator